ncbi:hypothetical protein [Aurantimonas coralicida]|uniref:hypothetical protein n=1 Tax=Aurantimonas coralicida TaxID=182270 RepID=UPI001D18E24D|nr:hypothetical protein [Aurantimonas coralicida]MCC4296626.1 hypothetical protein [Aurantimonas coralicida]
MKLETSIGPLLVTQGELTSKESLLHDYDIAIAAISWESRAVTALPFMNGRSSETVLLRFASSDRSVDGLKDRTQSAADKILGTYRLESLMGSTVWNENVAALDRLMTEAVGRAGRPISVLLDITCLPKRYALFLIGRGFRQEHVARMDVLYAEAERYETTKLAHSGAVNIVSEGAWTSVQVPYFEGNNYTPDKRDLFISLGGEITNAIPLIERFEANELQLYAVENTSVRLPKAQYDGEAPVRQRLLDMPNSFNKDFALEDIVGLAEDVLKSTHLPTTCLAIGPKTHALAFGLAALANDSIQLVCRSPGRYLATDALPSGRVFLFQIQDRFEPRAYWK